MPFHVTTLAALVPVENQLIAPLATKVIIENRNMESVSAKRASLTTSATRNVWHVTLDVSLAPVRKIRTVLNQDQTTIRTKKEPSYQMMDTMTLGKKLKNVIPNVPPAQDLKRTSAPVVSKVESLEKENVRLTMVGSTLKTLLLLLKSVMPPAILAMGLMKLIAQGVLLKPIGT